jgi:hypothetical protein
MERTPPVELFDAGCLGVCFTAGLAVAVCVGAEVLALGADDTGLTLGTGADAGAG